VPLAELPVFSEMLARDIIGGIDALLSTAGGVRKIPPPVPRPPRQPSHRPATAGDGFFHNVNQAALADIPAWVQALHPGFRDRGRSGWRLSSEDLGRPYEEDISVHLDGIRDFGPAPDEKGLPLTAVDLVIQLGAAADALGAARWLCDRLGVTSQSLGWRAGRPPEPPPLEPEPAGCQPPDAAAPGGDGSAPPPGGVIPPTGSNQGDKPGDDGDAQIPDLEVADDLDIKLLEDRSGGDDEDDGGEPTEEQLEERARAVEAQMEEKLATLNRHFAVVNEAGKCIVMKRTRDPVFGNREMLERISFDDLARMYLPRRVKTVRREVTSQGTKYIFGSKQLIPWWLNHPRRREYLGGVTFDPTGKAPGNFLNLWRGFAVKPVPGEWGLMKDHLLKVICRGDPARGEYFLNWLALMVQHPEEPGEVALVIRSDEEGTGKGLLGRYLVKLCGHHGLHITHAPHLTGRFNAHLHDCCFLFADEAFFAGDKQHGDILKGLITEYTLTIEGKYRAVVIVRNRLHILIVSNRDWVVPASMTARRFAVTEALDTKKGQRAYFRAIIDQMENGGLGAMLHELLHRDLSHFEVRDIPETDELNEQKLLSLSSIERWWLAVLERGFLYRSRHGAPWFGEWQEFYTTSLLLHSYRQWCEENRPFDRKSREQLGRFLTKWHSPSRPRLPHPVYEIESIDRSETREIVSSTGTVLSPGRPLDEVAIYYLPNQHGFYIGELDEARDRFTEMMPGIDTSWRNRADE
jgi:hypothetical protein